jgi:hypothetical protein
MDHYTKLHQQNNNKLYRYNGYNSLQLAYMSHPSFYSPPIFLSKKSQLFRFPNAPAFATPV